jgi:hypothetical protein
MRPATAPASSGRRGVRPAFIVIGVSILALVVMWTYILFYADTTNPNRIADRAWATQAQATCTRYTNQINALPDAATFAKIKPKSEALRQRAAVGQQATDLLVRMVAELRALPVADGVSRDAVGRWLTDYGTYIGDRQRQQAKWAAGQDPQFAETADHGHPLSVGMDDFSVANDMPACQVPQDMG